MEEEAQKYFVLGNRWDVAVTATGGIEQEILTLNNTLREKKTQYKYSLD